MKPKIQQTQFGSITIGGLVFEPDVVALRAFPGIGLTQDTPVHASMPDTRPGHAAAPPPVAGVDAVCCW